MNSLSPFLGSVINKEMSMLHIILHRRDVIMHNHNAERKCEVIEPPVFGILRIHSAVCDVPWIELEITDIIATCPLYSPRRSAACMAFSLATHPYGESFDMRVGAEVKVLSVRCSFTYFYFFLCIGPSASSVNSTCAGPDQGCLRRSCLSTRNPNRVDLFHLHRIGQSAQL